jgi:hypothetical protein
LIGALISFILLLLFVLWWYLDSVFPSFNFTVAIYLGALISFNILLQLQLLLLL